jgi:hypothetical protein
MRRGAQAGLSDYGFQVLSIVRITGEKNPAGGTSSGVSTNHVAFGCEEFDQRSPGYVRELGDLLGLEVHALDKAICSAEVKPFRLVQAAAEVDVLNGADEEAWGAAFDERQLDCPVDADDPWGSLVRRYIPNLRIGADGRGESDEDQHCSAETLVHETSPLGALR